MVMLGDECSACRVGESLRFSLGCSPSAGLTPWPSPASLGGVGAAGQTHSRAFPVFPCRHLNAVELGATSFWLRVALGAAVTALVGFTLYRLLAKNK